MIASMERLQQLADKEKLSNAEMAEAEEAAADDLLTQELAAESAQSQDMRHGLCVPSFGQHADRNDVAHLFAQNIFRYGL